MLNNFKIITITHKNVSLQTLSKFIVPSTDEAELQLKLNNLKEQFGIEEMMYLATCNRVMYFFYAEKNVNESFVAEFLSHANPQFQTDLVDDFSKRITMLEGHDALEHLLEVSSSIDSMVIGEREILRQIRTAFDQCVGWDMTGDHLRLAMQLAVETAKKVYSKTRIGEKPVSVVSLAIQKLLQSGFSKTGKLLLIGAGQTNLLVSKFLKKYEYQNVTVFNRSIERANSLAEMLKGNAFLLEDLKKYQEGFDGIIICTGSDKALLDDELYASLLQGDKSRKLIIDLAIPNNVEQSVAENFNVNYIEIEDLRSLAKENMGFRQKEISSAQKIIEKNLVKFQKTHQQRQITKAMSHVPQKIKAVKAHAMNEVFKKDVDELDENARELLERVLTYMEKRCISIPMEAAKNTVS
ncbi:MAG: glutamyl-tRNA reductase [Saprospiraceae bacterium]